jgi:pimeloyl-ACP methyl ester carboxylesterase
VTPNLQFGSLLQSALREDAGYFEVAGAHLYTMLHRAAEPVARVLLIGPFASERQNSYLPWVRWARYLAARGFEVLRYDYRGVGESLGKFEEATFSNWADDLALLSDWFKKREPEMPLLLHGLEIGALFACSAFQHRIGDALLLWSPPADANQALRSTLLRWVGLEQLLKPGAERRSAADYIRQLEQGQSIEVEGYQWSACLWQESFAWKLPSDLADEQRPETQERPIKIVKLPKEAAPLVKGGFVGYDEVKDFDWLFSENIKWIQEQFATCGSTSNDASR